MTQDTRRQASGPSRLSRRKLLRLTGVTVAAFGAGRLGERIAAIGELPAGAAARPLAPGEPLAPAGPLAPVRPAQPTLPAPACVVRPQQTEGPYFVDELLHRSDIRSDPASGVVREGARLRLVFRVTRIESGGDCTPVHGAVVDIWQCDAAGVYSDVLDTGGLFDTRGQKFLRGYQVTGADGVATFTTLYPGWYPGRTVHIHFKIRTDPAASQGYEFTSQLYFDDSLTDQVFTHPPYAATGQRTTRNPQDGIYRGGGDQLLLGVSQDGDGLAATFDIGLRGLPAFPTPTPGSRSETATPTQAPETPTATTMPAEPTPTVAPTDVPATVAPTEPPPSATPVGSAEPGRGKVYLPWGERGGDSG